MRNNQLSNTSRIIGIVEFTVADGTRFRYYCKSRKIYRTKFNKSKCEYLKNLFYDTKRKYPKDGMKFPFPVDIFRYYNSRL